MNGLGMLDYSEASQLTGLSESSLRRYVSRGLIPFKKVGKRRVFFVKEEIERWIDDGPQPLRKLELAGRNGGRNAER